MKILLLGGTADARQLADQLHLKGLQVVYSIAGLVRIPKLGCEVLVGGFTQFGGLERYLVEHKISLVINATHPYAQKMANTAVSASRQAGITCWRFLRPEWQRMKGDNWTYYQNDDELQAALSNFKRPLLSAGQHSEPFIQSIAALCGVEVVHWRTAVPPKFNIPARISWRKAIGPFDLESERTFISDNNVDVIVSKNSGGVSTYAKLEAARELFLPVLMRKRPITETASATYVSQDEIIASIIDFRHQFHRYDETQQGSAQQ
ncbi:precorrin-6A/cobalt-precorrin-6A reductase [Marinomonas mediterranea]|uniref:Precorrin-6A reductase n=1 Tax=Marinomonas mediterranea (strain ATCC 700492 / JCM 21426 / NBRC 103028 / MMB-1) TaxID=717774 RepID=F2JUU6_MARM1|nr:precorrin-6A/cobalt-precorrin-6A reductase [Marinomonas mediterranea]ADZ90511.1 Precorrin-6A reductase [Marinomonas mediterranea MMB-1]WCN16690.1 cobalt-precorrin-6A reductase [Marinomonas mediterranea MMB-1]